MFFQRKRQGRGAGGARPAPAAARRLYSIHGLPEGRVFAGQFEAPGGSYGWEFAPAAAELVGGKLQLTGRLRVRPQRGAERVAEGVRATLASTQGAIGTSPARRQLVRSTTQTGNISSPTQKQEEAKAPETTEAPPEPDKALPSRPPVTEATGPLAFVGVMYFHFQPLDGRALGVPLDLSRVQLNARLAPVDDTARDLLWLYSDLVAATYVEKPDPRAAAESLGEINRLLAG
jgi:hypothetical protein